jgi:hypothetical protein
MDGDAAFVLYALLFRSAVIGAGLFTIYLGHSLLRQRPGRGGSPSEKGSQVEASIPGVRFRLQSVTAGSIFALFGAVLIIAMVLQGNPERSHQILTGGGVRSETVKTRGADLDPILTSIQSADDAVQRGDIPAAEKLYRLALYQTAPALNGLAWVYNQKGIVQEALPLAKSAVYLDKDNAHYLETLANVEMAVGDQAAAIRAIEKAAQLDPTFKSRINKFREVPPK